MWGWRLPGALVLMLFGFGSHPLGHWAPRAVVARRKGSINNGGARAKDATSTRTASYSPPITAKRQHDLHTNPLLTLLPLLSVQSCLLFVFRCSLLSGPVSSCSSSCTYLLSRTSNDAQLILLLEGRQTSSSTRRVVPVEIPLPCHSRPSLP